MPIKPSTIVEVSEDGEKVTFWKKFGWQVGWRAKLVKVVYTN
jgi:hypothetical protein